MKTSPMYKQSPSSKSFGAKHDLPQNKFSFWVDGGISLFGSTVSWLWIVTLAVVLTNVFGRFVLGRGSIALEELSWHLFGAAMMLTLAYAVVTDDHVRVDVLREKFSPKVKCWIEILAIVCLVLPLLFIVLEELIQYAWRSYIRGERSQAPSGLPYRFIVKSMLPIGISLVIVAMISRVTRCCTLIFGFPRPYTPNRNGASGKHINGEVS